MSRVHKKANKLLKKHGLNPAASHAKVARRLAAAGLVSFEASEVNKRGGKALLEEHAHEIDATLGRLKQNLSVGRCKPSKHRQKSKGDRFYASWEWKRARYEVLKHYGGQCMLCGSAERLVVDHIKPRSKRPDLALEFGNLQVLCNSCNMGKSNVDETDWRPEAEPLPEGAESHMSRIAAEA